MFYATYDGYEDTEIAEFDTREALETWLNYQDRFTQEFGSIKKDRKELKNKRRIARILKDPRYIRTTDFDGIRWIFYNPSAVL